MRIALVAEDYYPQLGGVPEHVHHLALQLRRWGHDAQIVTSRMRGQGRDLPFVHRVGTSLVIYANGGVARLTVGWRLRRRLEALFRAERYDVVHVHGGLAPTLGLAAPSAAWRAGIPVVATFHTWFPRSAGYRLMRRPLQRMLDRHAATIAVSRPVVEAMSRYFRADWEIIPNGVDLTAFRPDGRQPDDALRRGPRLLFLGRLEPRNGLDLLLGAMPRILTRFPTATLTVAGDGPWRRSYERLARRAGVAASVRFLGAVFAERRDLYATADLYLCPTERASFGITLLEAMACGTPLVLRENAGFRAVVQEGPEAAFVRGRDLTAWADTIIGLIEDVDRRRVMGEAGLASAARFAWPVIARRELDVYQRVTG